LPAEQVATDAAYSRCEANPKIAQRPGTYGARRGPDMHHSMNRKTLNVKELV